MAPVYECGNPRRRAVDGQRSQMARNRIVTFITGHHLCVPHLNPIQLYIQHCNDYNLLRIYEYHAVIPFAWTKNG